MNPNYKVTPFADYLQSIVKLNALDKITQSLDNELADSQRVMEDIKDIFDSIPMAHVAAPTGNNGLRHEDVSKFLDAGVPKLLMPDMTENNIDVDLDDVIATMKGYAEDLKKNLMTSQPQPHDTPKDMKSLDLQQYASSLDQLNKRLANIKLSKRDDTNNKNANLEAKLEQLCEDVNMFTQVYQYCHYMYTILLKMVLLLLIFSRWYKLRPH